MTPLMSKKELAELGAPDLVYVREISGAEIIASTPVAAEEFVLMREPTRLV